MFSVIAMKSRILSSFSYSADEQMRRRWEGAQPGRQPSWAMDIFHTMGVMLCLWMVVGSGAGIFFLFRVHEFKSSLVREFELFLEFGLFPGVWRVKKNSWLWQNPLNLWALGNLWVLRPLLGHWLWNQLLGDEIIALYTVCFSHS